MQKNCRQHNLPYIYINLNLKVEADRLFVCQDCVLGLVQRDHLVNFTENVEKSKDYYYKLIFSQCDSLMAAHNLLNQFEEQKKRIIGEIELMKRDVLWRLLFNENLFMLQPLLDLIEKPEQQQQVQELHSFLKDVRDLDNHFSQFNIPPSISLQLKSCQVSITKSNQLQQQQQSQDIMEEEISYQPIMEALFSQNNKNIFTALPESYPLYSNLDLFTNKHDVFKMQFDVKLQPAFQSTIGLYIENKNGQKIAGFHFLIKNQFLNQKQLEYRGLLFAMVLGIQLKIKKLEIYGSAFTAKQQIEKYYIPKIFIQEYNLFKTLKTYFTAFGFHHNIIKSNKDYSSILASKNVPQFQSLKIQTLYNDQYLIYEIILQL